MLKLPLVIGHRGACAYAPENTLASFQKAAELGIEWVEFDVQMTADEQLIILHDSSLNRTTSATGHLAEWEYSDLAQLDAGSWFSAQFSDQKIPRFEEILLFLASQKIGINVELKAQSGYEEKLAHAVVDCLNREWPDDLPTPLLSSFSDKCTSILSKIKGNYALALLVSAWDENWEKQADEWECSTVHMPHSITQAEFVEQVQKTGRRFLNYTVNDPVLAQKLFSWGVDALFSDKPDKIMKKDCN